MVQDGLEATHVLHQRSHGLEQASDVPRPDVLLLAVAVASTARIGGVGRPVHVKRLQPAIGTVVDRETVNRHVVRVHDAVDETDPHPVGDHHRRSLCHFGHPSDEAIIGARIVMREVMAYGVIDEGSKRFVVTVGDMDLEAAEADETGRHAAHHRPGFRRRIAIVEHVSDDRFTRGHERERPSGGHAEVMHRFAAEEFSDGGAQHGFAVGSARIRRETGTFELQFEDAVLRFDFTKRNGSPVAQLAGPVSELVTPVALRVGLHTSDGRTAAQHHAGFVSSLKPQRLGHLDGPEREVRIGGWRGRDLGPTLARNLTGTAAFGFIAWRLVQKASMP